MSNVTVDSVGRQRGDGRPLGRTLAIGSTIVLLVTAAFEAAIVARQVQTENVLAIDIDAYVEYAQMWLAGHGFYLDAQLAGPYVVEELFANVYPPTLLYVVVPFALGLPTVLFWVIPLTVLAAAILRARPGWWGLALLALALALPRTWSILVTGNPSMWAIAAAAAGVVWGWPAVGAAIKTTFAPLALVGARRRSWWVAMVIAILLALPFGTLWFDYLTAVANATSSRGASYVLGEWPTALAIVGAVSERRLRRVLPESLGRVRARYTRAVAQ